MTNSGDPSSNKSQPEKQATPQTQSETNVVVATSSSSSQHVPTTEIGPRTFVRPFPPPPPPPPLRPRATLPPPPPRPQAIGGGGMSGKGSSILVGLGGGIQVGGSGGGSAAAHHEIGGSSRPKRKAAEIVAPAGVEPICSVCRRDFGSWKALFGHMRSHPERQWRGCFPPPGVQQPTQGDQGPRAEGVGSSSEGSQVAPMNIDLNQPQEGETASASSPSNKDGVIGTFDLNMPPPSDDDDQDI